jgi:hypothetical protein
MHADGVYLTIILWEKDLCCKVKLITGCLFVSASGTARGLSLLYQSKATSNFSWFGNADHGLLKKWVGAVQFDLDGGRPWRWWSCGNIEDDWHWRRRDQEYGFSISTGISVAEQGRLLAEQGRLKAEQRRLKAEEDPESMQRKLETRKQVWYPDGELLQQWFRASKGSCNGRQHLHWPAAVPVMLDQMISCSHRRKLQQR